MLTTLALLALATSPQLTGPVDFNRDVRPILASRCFACHGPDASSREANLRLDSRAGATQDLGGYAAISPGDLTTSELWQRVTSTSDAQRMPPASSHKPALSSDELRIISRWIEDGATWARHWSFVPPKKRTLTRTLAPDQHPIDSLIEDRLRTEGLTLSRQAAPHVLARRLAMDLTGLPPSPSLLTTLGTSPAARDWNSYTEQLLASPHYGERLAMWWLDVARYADSDGYQQDETRTNWAWRDWVVQAFQEGMPFDEFTTQQIAGDLLPNATPEQVLATCFQRNHMHNGEGGRDPEESRIDYVRDRTNTLGTVWLGLTLECAQCHDHKFDPISQRDYYSLSAFFDSVDESGRAGTGAGPFLEYASSLVGPHIELAQQESDAANAHRHQVEQQQKPAFELWLAERRSETASGHPTWTTLLPSALGSAEGCMLSVLPDNSIRCDSPGLPQDDYFASFDKLPIQRVTAFKLEVFGDTPKPALSFADDGEFIVTGVKCRVVGNSGKSVRDIKLIGAVAQPVGEGVDKQYGQPKGVLDDDPRTGWTTRGRDIESTARIILELASPLTLADGERMTLEILQRSTVERAQLRRFSIHATDQRGSTVRTLGPVPLERLAEHDTNATAPVDSDSLPKDLRDALFDQFLEDIPAWQRAKHACDRFAAQLAGARKASEELKVTVLRERAESRSTSILERGVWDQKGDTVQRSFPASLHAPPEIESPSRLDLARWVTSRENPLTARVIVNQIWQLLFGAGLVRSPGDFGMQGQHPLYPDVLDWLAVDFMEHDWDLRHLTRTIVSSRTYRQSSHASSRAYELDPKNERLARGARFRYPSWMIRDAALASSGLLERTIGGPPMFPHQPEGVWEDVFNGRFQYTPTMGGSRHRRTLYGFWRRNAAPTYLFDSADRRTCAVDVRRTNTPLQALTLLNDKAFFGAAVALARSSQLSGSAGLREHIQRMAQRVLLRELTRDELQVAMEVHESVQATFKRDPESAAQLIARSELDVPRHEEDASRVDENLAATVIIANLLLNLDELVTHE